MFRLNTRQFFVHWTQLFSIMIDFHSQLILLITLIIYRIYSYLEPDLKLGIISERPSRQTSLTSCSPAVNAVKERTGSCGFESLSEGENRQRRSLFVFPSLNIILNFYSLSLDFLTKVLSEDSVLVESWHRRIVQC